EHCLQIVRAPRSDADHAQRDRLAGSRSITLPKHMGRYDGRKRGCGGGRRAPVEEGSPSGGRPTRHGTWAPSKRRREIARGTTCSPFYRPQTDDKTGGFEGARGKATGGEPSA